MKVIRALIFSSILLIVACAWDDDTLSMEAKGLPTVIDAIVGRIPINPPEYYHARIKISTEKLKNNPNDLEQYDNLGVACDKIGDSNAAIAWMQKKEKVMKTQGIKPGTDPLRDPWYRYHANLGTFYAHKWIRANEPDKLELLDKAQAELETAIKINPKAHFGREIVQLEAIVQMKKYVMNRRFFGAPFHDLVAEHGSDAVAEGLIGMMTLGNGAESRDMLSILSYAVSNNLSSIHELIAHRDKELKSTGKARVIEPNLAFGMSRNETGLNKQFIALRENAKEYHQKRTQFILDQLKAGKHPDTHADFWTGYEDVPRIDITKFEPTPVNRFLQRNKYQNAMLVIAGGAIILIIPAYIWRRRRLKRV